MPLTARELAAITARAQAAAKRAAGSPSPPPTTVGKVPGPTAPTAPPGRLTGTLTLKAPPSSAPTPPEPPPPSRDRAAAGSSLSKLLKMAKSAKLPDSPKPAILSRTVSRGMPTASAPSDAEVSRAAWEKKRAAMRAMERRLISEYGAVFDPAAPKPLAIGIHRDVVRATGATGVIVRLVLGAWTSRPAYLAALVAGAARFGLDGSVAGAVTEEQAAIARAAAERRAARRASEPTASG